MKSSVTVFQTCISLRTATSSTVIVTHSVYYASSACCALISLNVLLLFTVDVTVYHDGYHGDVNETFLVGKVDEEGKKLVQTTLECLEQAIAVCKWHPL